MLLPRRSDHRVHLKPDSLPQTTNVSLIGSPSRNSVSKQMALMSRSPKGIKLRARVTGKFLPFRMNIWDTVKTFGQNSNLNQPEAIHSIDRDGAASHVFSISDPVLGLSFFLPSINCTAGIDVYVTIPHEPPIGSNHLQVVWELSGPGEPHCGVESLPPT